MNPVLRTTAPCALVLFALVTIGSFPAAQTRRTFGSAPHVDSLRRHGSQRMDASLQRAFQQAIYRPDLGRDGAVSLENPAQRLSADLSRNGLRLRCGDGNRTSVLLHARSVGYGIDARPLSASAPSIQGDRATLRHDGVTEWYLNTPKGIEQGFTVPARQSARASAGRLSLRLEVTGGLKPMLLSDGRGVRLTGHGIDLVYRDLCAWDARHRALPARMTVRAGEVALEVDDRGASYPITIDPILQQQELSASDGALLDEFGASVTIRGDRAVIGAPNASGYGAAYVFTRSGTVWTQQAKLVPPVQTFFGFGWSVATYDCVYPSGQIPTVAVGAPSISDGGAGAVFLFTYTGGAWNYLQTISPGQSGDRYGYSLALDYGYLYVGDPSPNSGSVVIYQESSGQWIPFQTITPGVSTPYFGYTLAEANGTLAVTDLSDNDVLVYTPDFSSGNWVWTETLQQPDPTYLDYFGYSLNVDFFTGNIAVGAPGHNTDTGAAYLFTYSGGAWGGVQEMTALDGKEGDFFGSAIASEYNQVVVGASTYDDGSETYPGALYVFLKTPTGAFAQSQEFVGNPGTSPGYFGAAVSMYNGSVLVGALGDAGTGNAFAYAPAPAVTANDDSYQMPESTTLTADAAHGVLANDINLGTGPFTAKLVSSTNAGQLTFGADGSFTYIPHYGFLGTDTFQYVAHNDQGDSNVATVTLAVSLPSVINMRSVTCDEGGSVTLKTTLGQGTFFDPHKVIPGANLTFWVNNQQIGAATTNSNGTASLPYTPPAPGITAVTVQFAGNKTYAPSTGLGAVIVRYKTAMSFKADYAEVGQGALPLGTIMATYTNSVLIGVKVNLYHGAKLVGTTTSDANGYVAFNLGNQSHAGTFNYTAVYDGDGYNQGCNAPVTLTVYSAPTALSLSNAVGTIGKSVTLKATLTEQVHLSGVGGVPVVFSVNGNAIGTAVTAKGGIASLVYTIPAGTPVGPNALLASFAGDKDYSASTSGPATLTVHSATSVSVSGASGSAGQHVMLKAQLLTSPGGSGVSGETLAFNVDGKAAGSVQTDGSGKASMSYLIGAKAALGSHTITVTHKASTYYGASSGTATLTVH